MSDQRTVENFAHLNGVKEIASTLWVDKSYPVGTVHGSSEKNIMMNMHCLNTVSSLIKIVNSRIDLEQTKCITSTVS